jgi:hypothetical protein
VGPQVGPAGADTGSMTDAGGLAGAGAVALGWGVTQAITTRAFRLWIDEEGIVRTEAFAGSEQTRADAEEVVALRLGMTGRPRPILVDIRRIKSIDHDARAYFASPAGSAELTAVALVIDSPLTRVIANFYLGIHRPGVPTRMFTAEGAALAWLRRFLE